MGKVNLGLKFFFGGGGVYSHFFSYKHSRSKIYDHHTQVILPFTLLVNIQTHNNLVQWKMVLKYLIFSHMLQKEHLFGLLVQTSQIYLTFEAGWDLICRRNSKVCCQTFQFQPAINSFSFRNVNGTSLNLDSPQSTCRAGLIILVGFGLSTIFSASELSRARMLIVLALPARLVCL